MPAPKKIGAPLRDPDLGPRVSLCLRLRPDLAVWLRAYARREGISLAAAVDRAVLLLANGPPPQI